MAPSEPKNPVATIPGGLWALRDLTYRLAAQQTVGTLLLLPARTIYRGICKQCGIIRVRMDYVHSIAKKEETKEMIGAQYVII